MMARRNQGGRALITICLSVVMARPWTLNAEENLSPDAGLDEATVPDTDDATESVTGDNELDAAEGETADIGIEPEVASEEADKAESPTDPAELGQEVAAFESSDDLLSMSLEDLLDTPITVASKTSMEASEAPSIVTVIPRTTIEAMGYRSIAEALRSVPGFFVMDDLITHNVAVRGVHAGPDSWSRIIKVMINGHDATYQATGGTLLGPELIPIEAVESIEIIRGTGSALYGANAFLGVVNIVTRKPKADGAHLEAGGEVGVVNAKKAGGGSVLGSVAKGRSFLLISFHGDYVDRSGLQVPDSSPAKDEWGGATSENDLSRPWALFTNGTFDLGPFGTLHAQFSHQELDAFGEFSYHSTLTHHNRINLKNDIVGLDHRLAFVDDTLNIHTYGTLARGGDLPEEHLDVGDQLSWFRRERVTENMTIGSETSFTRWGQSLMLGFEYQGLRDNGDKTYQVVREDSEYADAGDQLIYKPSSMMRLSNYGLFSQLMLEPIDRLGLTGGIRHDWNDKWDNHLNYRVAAVYSFLFGLSLKAVYGTSYVPPAPAQLETSPLQFEGGIVGNPDLKSQKASTADLAVEYKYKEYFNIALNGFYTQIKDRVEFVFTGNTLTARNVAASRTLGAELTARGFYQPLFSEINVSYQYTIPTDEPELTPSWWRTLYSEDGAGGKRLLYYPNWIIHGNLGVTFPRYFFQASMTVNYIGERKSSAANIRYNGEAYLLSRYATVDMTLRTLGFKPIRDKTTTISIHVNNIFDQRYAEAGYLGVDIPSLGRTLYLRLIQEF